MSESFNVTYLKPREVLGRYLAEQGFPGSAWEGSFNEEQKEYWYKRADHLLEFIRRNRIL